MVKPTDAVKHTEVKVVSHWTTWARPGRVSSRRSARRAGSYTCHSHEEIQELLSVLLTRSRKYDTTLSRSIPRACAAFAAASSTGSTHAIITRRRKRPPPASHRGL